LGGGRGERTWRQGGRTACTRTQGKKGKLENVRKTTIWQIMPKGVKGLGERGGGKFSNRRDDATRLCQIEVKRGCCPSRGKLGLE